MSLIPYKIFPYLNTFGKNPPMYSEEADLNSLYDGDLENNIKVIKLFLLCYKDTIYKVWLQSILPFQLHVWHLFKRFDGQNLTFQTAVVT